MDRIKQLKPNLYTADMSRGKIVIAPSTDFSCHFIVNAKENAEFIRSQAKELLLSGCKHFDFYGAKAGLWHKYFDETDVKYRTGDVALTRIWESLEHFVENLAFDIMNSKDRPSDGILGKKFYILFDDSRVCREAVERLRDWCGA